MPLALLRDDGLGRVDLTAARIKSSIHHLPNRPGRGSPVEPVISGGQVRATSMA